MRKILSAKERSEKFIKRTKNCWLWIGSKNENGYGIFKGNNRKLEKAHRVIYEIFVGPIPKGKQLDHLCRNRSCVNPKHLEPVTRRENILRGENFCGKNARKTHCKRGHLFDKKNTYLCLRKNGNKERSCRTCQRQRRHP